jgi:hypothetical protein
MVLLVKAILKDILGRSGAFVPVSGVLKDSNNCNN